MDTHSVKSAIKLIQVDTHSVKSAIKLIQVDTHSVKSAILNGTLLVMSFKSRRQANILCQQILLCQCSNWLRQKYTYGNMTESKLL